MVRVQFIFAALLRPHRLAWPRTLPFQGSNTGSNPVGDTRKIRRSATRASLQPSSKAFVAHCYSPATALGGCYVYSFSSQEAQIHLPSHSDTTPATTILR